MYTAQANRAWLGRRAHLDGVLLHQLEHALCDVTARFARGQRLPHGLCAADETFLEARVHRQQTQLALRQPLLASWHVRHLHAWTLSHAAMGAPIAQVDFGVGVPGRLRSATARGLEHAQPHAGGPRMKEAMEAWTYGISNA